MADIKYSNYVLAGIAAMGATVLTNPLEVKFYFHISKSISSSLLALKKTGGQNSAPTPG